MIIDQFKEEHEQKLDNYKKALATILLDKKILNFLKSFFQSDLTKKYIQEAMVLNEESVKFYINRPKQILPELSYTIPFCEYLEDVFFEKRFFGLYKKQTLFPTIEFNDFLLYVSNSDYLSKFNLFSVVLEENPHILKKFQDEIQSNNMQISISKNSIVFEIIF